MKTAPASLLALIGRPVDDLPTPSLTLERPLLEANLTRMQDLIDRAGRQLRAHAKSHKCTRLAREQIRRGAVGICAAKLSEAEGLLKAGIGEVLVTGPIVSREAHERLARCVARGESILITLDDETNATSISRLLSETDGPPLRFLLDLDVGQHRTGVPPEKALALAERLARLPHLQMVGVQAYAGHLQHYPSRETRREASLACMALAVETFERLRSDEVRILSTSGTGSFEFDLTLEAITEVQPGSYPLMDADYLAVEPSVGTRWGFDPALKLRTRVMSTQHAGFVTIDAGLKAVYSDGPTPLVEQEGDALLTYEWFGDEYGKISGPPEAIAALKTGDLLTLITSHCDPTVNLFDHFFVVEEGVVTDVWPIDLRGCCY